MKIYVVIENPGYGEYVHLVKAESAEEAKNVVSKKFLALVCKAKYSTIDSVTALDDFLSLLNDNDSICIGGYEE